MLRFRVSRLLAATIGCARASSTFPSSSAEDSSPRLEDTASTETITSSSSNEAMKETNSFSGTEPLPDAALSSSARGSYKILTPRTLLKVIQADPGKTAAYYSTRYFGKESEPEVVHLLWTQLKQYGLAQVDRRDGPHSTPCWIPTYRPQNRVHVTRHNPEDEDLTVLRSAPLSDRGTNTSADPKLPTGSIIDAIIESMKPSVLKLVRDVPDRDIHFYIRQLAEDQRPVGALVFKRMRAEGTIERYSTGSSSSFRWRLPSAATQA